MIELDKEKSRTEMAFHDFVPPAVVKRIKSKEDFLMMPFKERNCNKELYEDCWTRSLLEECKCVPWDVPGFQVKT